MAWSDSWGQRRHGDSWRGGWQQSKGHGKGREGKGWRDTEALGPSPPRQRGLAGALQQVRDAAMEQQQVQAMTRIIGPALEGQLMTTPMAAAYMATAPQMTPPLIPPPSAPPEALGWPVVQSVPSPAPTHFPGDGRDSGAADGILAKIRSILIGTPSRPAAAEEKRRAAPAPALGDGTDETLDLVRTFSKEVAELKKDNLRLKAGGDGRGRPTPCGTSTSPPRRPDTMRDKVREALAAAISDDCERSGPGAQAHDVDFDVDDGDGEMSTPSEHARFFASMGAKSSLKKPVPLKDWACVAARKWSSEEWAQKIAKVGYAGDFAHKLKGIQGALQHWRQ